MMLWGLGGFTTEYGIPPDEMAREVETRGFESLWISEHLHMPVSCADRFPRDYAWCYDPFMALAVMASATEKLILATGIAQVMQRDPIETAKQVATLDRLSERTFSFLASAREGTYERKSRITARIIRHDSAYSVTASRP